MKYNFNVTPKRYILSLSKKDVCEAVIEYLRNNGSLPAGDIEWEVSMDSRGHRGEGHVVLKGFEKSLVQDFDACDDGE